MPVQIDDILWHQVGSLIEVHYSDWRTVHSRGNRLAAEELAERAGLRLIPGPDGVARWVRESGSGHTIPPGVVE